MISIRKAMEELNGIVNEHNRLEFARNKYGKYLIDDVIQYYLVRHCNQHDDMTEFDHIDITNCEILTSSVNSKEVFTKICYADFCTFRNEDKTIYESLKNNSYYHWKCGTWSAPILVTPKDNKACYTRRK